MAIASFSDAFVVMGEGTAGGRLDSTEEKPRKAYWLQGMVSGIFHLYDDFFEGRRDV